MDHTEACAKRVSVIIPAFNSAPTIGRAITSILEQTSPAYEILVIDDGSRDNLRHALEPFAEHIRLISQPNRGASSARNRGIDEATGDFVAFLDADDYWEPVKLRKQVDLFHAQPQVGFVASSLYLEHPGQPRYADPALDASLMDRPLRLSPGDAFDAAGMFWTGTVMVRREVLHTERFDETLSTAEDRELWFRLLLKSAGWILGEPLATCVLVSGSLSRSNVNRDCINMLAVVDRYRQVLGPEPYRRWVAEIHRRWSTRLLAEGSPRQSLTPAFVALASAPSARTLYTAVKTSARALKSATSLERPLQSRLQVDVITDTARFFGLDKEWQSLHERCATRSYSTSWEWLYTWWEVFQQDRELRILTARIDGALVGIAPLVLRDLGWAGGRIRRLELLGTGEHGADEILSEYLDWILEPGLEHDLITAFWSTLASVPEWDQIQLASVPAQSRLRRHLRDAAADAALPLKEQERPEAIIVDLSPTGEEFLASQSRKMREDLRRHRRMLEQRGEVRLVRADTAEQLADMFPVFSRLHQALWRSRGKPGCFASSRFSRFHELVSKRLFGRGLVDLTLMTCAGEPVSARYGFPFGRRMFEYQSGFDPSWDSRISLATVSTHMCMESAMARGFTQYDLGEGPRPYKLRWPHTRYRTYNLLLSRRNTRTVLAEAAASAGRALRTATRRVRSDADNAT